jgi:hypothetical protein
MTAVAKSASRAPSTARECLPWRIRTSPAARRRRAPAPPLLQVDDREGRPRSFHPRRLMHREHVRSGRVATRAPPYSSSNGLSDWRHTEGRLSSLSFDFDDRYPMRAPRHARRSIDSADTTHSDLHRDDGPLARVSRRAIAARYAESNPPLYPMAIDPGRGARSRAAPPSLPRPALRFRRSTPSWKRNRAPRPLRYERSATYDA